MTKSPEPKNKLSLLKNLSFLIETIYIIIIIVITIMILLDIIDTGFFVGQLRFSHWMGIFGAIFMLVFPPIFYILKRRRPNQYKIWMNIHIFGFTTSFLLVSIHIGGQLSRPLPFYPDLGGGLALYIIVALLVATGYLQRYRPIRLKGKDKPQSHIHKSLHIGLLSGLYIVLIVHFVINWINTFN
ncbi:MAG: hypothetical protein EAX96_10350 [Candidatus Lokiarchaeota archaeon]|nr:hypothetical protein [Candidatus Lokiarchaeota archaeon]